MRGEAVEHPFRVDFDMKVWGSKDKLTIKYYTDPEKTQLVSHMTAFLDLAGVVTYYKTEEAHGCSYEEYLEFKTGPKVVLPRLWTQTMPPYVLYMGEMCADEDH